MSGAVTHRHPSGHVNDNPTRIAAFFDISEASQLSGYGPVLTVLKSKHVAPCEDVLSSVRIPTSPIAGIPGMGTLKEKAGVTAGIGTDHRLTTPPENASEALHVLAAGVCSVKPRLSVPAA